MLNSFQFININFPMKLEEKENRNKRRFKDLFFNIHSQISVQKRQQDYFSRPRGLAEVIVSHKQVYKTELQHHNSDLTYNRQGRTGGGEMCIDIHDEERDNDTLT